MEAELPVTTCREINPVSAYDQRWWERRHSWRHRSEEGGFNPDLYSVEAIDFATSAGYIRRHHYTGTYPADTKRFGLFVDDPEEGQALVGVAVFGVPAQMSVLRLAFPGLEPVTESVELSRLVLEGPPAAARARDMKRSTGPRPGWDRAPANSESFFVSRCFASLAAGGMRGVVSFADPVPRLVNGEKIFPGHVGTVYSALNGVWAGRSTPRTLTILPDGTSFNARTAQKVRSQERGHEAAERQLMAFGARCPRAGEDPKVWLAQALADIGCTRLRHRGCFRFLFTLGGPRQRARTVLGFPGQSPYPKSVDEVA